MAKFVVAGRSDCPYFARAELLGDRLSRTLDQFKFHKIMIQPDQWESWLQNTCAEKGWKFSKSPIVWRELIDRGGKGVLIGGANDFQEYVKAYYDLESEMNSYDMRTISNENKITKDELDAEEKAFKALSKPIHVCITNAGSPVCYHLLSTVSAGEVLGPTTEVTIRLLVSSEEDLDLVRGNAMEAEDLGHKLLRKVKVCTKAEEAFEDCSVIIMLDDITIKENESKLSWLTRNEEFFRSQAVIMNEKALKTCKVMLSGKGPLNFNAMTVIKHAPNLCRQNIVAVSTVKENHAKAVIGERLTVNPAGVVDLIMWGNVNGAHHFDVSKCRIHNYDGAIWGPYWYSVNSVEMIHDNKWIAREFPGVVEGWDNKVTHALQHSTCLSTANAVSTTLQYWYCGSPSGQLFSLGVCSDGWYGVPEGLVFSYPVTMDPKGYWHVAQDIELTPEAKTGIQTAVDDLKTEIGIFKGEVDENPKEVEEKTEAETKEEIAETGEEAGVPSTPAEKIDEEKPAEEGASQEESEEKKTEEGEEKKTEEGEEKKAEEGEEPTSGETSGGEVGEANETPADGSTDNTPPEEGEKPPEE